MMRRILVIEICSVPLDKVRKFAHTLPWRMPDLTQFVDFKSMAMLPTRK